MHRVSVVLILLGETSGTDVKEGCTRLGLVAIFVIATLPAVEHNANVVSFHVYFRNLVDVRVRGLLLFAGVAGGGAAATGVLVGLVGAVRASSALFVRVALRVVVVPAS